MWKMSWTDNKMQIQLALVVYCLISLTSVAAASDAKTAATRPPKHYVFYEMRFGGILPQGSWTKAYDYHWAPILNLGYGFMEHEHVGNDLHLPGRARVRVGAGKTLLAQPCLPSGLYLGHDSDSAG